MAWIPIRAADNDRALADAYAAVAGKRGKVANIMAVHSIHPDAMLSHLRLYVDLMFSRSELTRAERELIAVAVSRANCCAYCVSHHASSLRPLLRDDALVDAVAEAPDDAPLGARHRAVVNYALKLTRTPAAMSQADADALRTAGIGDRGIHDAAAVTGYFNFVNRIALGLGVELEAAAWDATSAPADLR